MNSEFHATVLILDFGSQYTQLIARRVRELNVYSKVLPADAEWERIIAEKPSALIFSGGPSSVYDSDAPRLPAPLEKILELKIPVLGICYGMQLFNFHLGGKVERAQSREYGRMNVLIENESVLWDIPGLQEKKVFQAWMSHGDETKAIAPGFKVTAKSASGAIAAMEDSDRRLFGFQFHPEVTHTHFGREILERFLFGVAGLRGDWKMGSLIEEQSQEILRKVGNDSHVICALSGGVDSAVAAALVHKAIGDRLHCVFVDHGLLRFQERDRVMKTFVEHLHLPVHCVDASEKFLGLLKGVTDPEQKRKIIGAEFIAVFDEYAIELSRELGHVPEFLVQGTLYPDVIESSPAPTLGGAGPKKKHSTTIKSHHNVGGLPENMRFQLVEPLRDLFKDEVRTLGRELGVPEAFVKRHPFPGPGLAVRIIGEITLENVATLQKVDEIFIQCIRDFGLYDQIWQAFAVFLPIRSVGVQGDGRTHDHVVALRAVTSQDGMTADWYPFDSEFLATVSAKICNEVDGVNRVVYDISSKPPATIEWE